MVVIDKTGRYMLAGEAAREIGVSGERVRQMLRRGNVEGLRLGSVWLLHEDDVTRLRDEHDAREAEVRERLQREVREATNRLRLLKGGRR